MPGFPAWYTRLFWAKAWPYRQSPPARIHLLEHHLADVGMCLEAVLSQPTVRQRLARLAGVDDLDETTVSRLCVFAALHDIGKVNIGFQTQVWTRGDFGDLHPTPRTGHTLDLVPVLVGDDQDTLKWFTDALGWDDLCNWDDQDGAVVSDLLIATLSHHGLPLSLDGGRAANPRVWSSFGDLDPEGYVRRLAGLVRGWFPAAWHSGAPPLPDKPGFQHMFLGLCMLADWLGSNERWFPYRSEPDTEYVNTARKIARQVVAQCGLDVGSQRENVHEQGGLPGFKDLFGYESANAIQEGAAMATPLDERLIIIESETGSGKTEAALWRFARLFETGRVDGLYFALPTRAAAVQIFDRVRHFVSAAFPAGSSPEVVLAVPGYYRAGDASGQMLQDYDVWWDDHPDDATRGRRWAAEGTKRYLAAQIAVGTVDQAMLSVLKVKHSHMRAACLARNLLVVDEVHSSDTYMGVILRALLDTHLRSGGHAVLMSATLGAAARRNWLAAEGNQAVVIPPLKDAIDCPYPAISTDAGSGERITATDRNGPDKRVRIEAVPLMNRFDEIALRALEAARDGARVLIIRNTVGHAVSSLLAIERAAGTADRRLLFGIGDVSAPHHGRFVAADRYELDRQVEEQLGKNRPREGGGLVVVGTQTLEQSIDIDADLLLTDLCPVDVLLQRIGRLHRHARSDRPTSYRIPVCVVLLPGVGHLSPLLQRGVNGLNQFVYPDVRILEATRRLVEHAGEWLIPAMNRELVERATHETALEAITNEMGEQWRKHADRIKGAELAEGLTARDVIAARDKSFFRDNREVGFGTMEDRIRTRLGDEGIAFELDSPQASPFGVASIRRVVVPRRWLPERWEDTSAITVRQDGWWGFRVGGRKLSYSRLGLHRDTHGPYAKATNPSAGPVQ